MARADGTDEGVEAGGGGGVHAGASDARLTELLRSSSAAAYPALHELRARHQPAVLAHARLCTTSESAARQLAAQAFTLAARETARGIDPGLPWRHQLLLLAGRVAAAWARDERAAGLEAGVLLILNAAAPGGPVPPMLGPFQSLPARTQGLIWYGVVERESADRTAGFLGLTRTDVVYGTEPALQAMAQACLRSRLAASDDPRCGDFRRLIEQSVRPDNPRASADLHAHMAHCAHCTTAHEELSALRDTPRTTLAEGLLPWAGTAYVTAQTPEHHLNAGSMHRTWPGTWPPSRRFVLTSAALSVALAPLLVLLLSQGESPGRQPAGATAAPPAPPRVTVTATVSAAPSNPSPSSSSSPSATSKSPSPTRSSSPLRKPSPTPPKSSSPAPPPPPPNGTYAQVVNLASGRCLDVGGAFSNGTDVITAPCTSSSTQRWRVDSERGVLQSFADPDFCLDSRGSVYRGVGIWSCDSVYGSNGQNLRFAVDARGVIRPAIAPDHAVTPADDWVSLETEEGRADQRWRAGAV